eukprot:scaffold2438_cov69-Phaeocystis_antarctica.AAC.6
MPSPVVSSTRQSPRPSPFESAMRQSVRPSPVVSTATEDTGWSGTPSPVLSSSSRSARPSPVLSSIIALRRNVGHCGMRGIGALFSSAPAASNGTHASAPAAVVPAAAAVVLNGTETPTMCALRALRSVRASVRENAPKTDQVSKLCSRDQTFSCGVTSSKTLTVG